MSVGSLVYQVMRVVDFNIRSVISQGKDNQNQNETEDKGEKYAYA